jgi:steroid delta-isomerase
LSYLEAVTSYYKLVDADDVEGLLDLFADDAVYDRPGYDPLVGMEALRMFYSSTRVIQSGTHAVTNLVVGENKIAAEGTFEGTLKNGAEVSLRWADFWTFGEDGKVTRRDSYFHTPVV